MDSLDEGWVKLHRKIVDNPVFKNSEALHLFAYLLLKANHKPNRLPFDGREMVIERGQLITGWVQISKATGLSRQQIRSRLELLRNLEILTIKSTNRFSIITICNYEYYQGEESDCQPPSQPSVNHQATTNKNDKKYKTIKCQDFETLSGFLLSLPEFQLFPLETKELISEFINRVRAANKTKTIQAGRVSQILDGLKVIQEKMDPECLVVGLKAVFRKVEKDGFDFSRRDPTAYVREVAKSHRAKVYHDRLAKLAMEEKEAGKGTPEGKVFQNLKSLIDPS